MSYLGTLEHSSVLSQPPFASGDVGLRAPPLDVGSSVFGEEMWQIQSERTKLEQENMLLRWQLENQRLARENTFLQQQITQQRMQSWVQSRGQTMGQNKLGRKGYGGSKEHIAKPGKAQQIVTEATLPNSCAFSEQSTTDTSNPSLPVSFNETGEMSPVENEKTTCMMRNIPEDYTRQMLLNLIDLMGFSGKYNLVYLPMDFKNKVNLGYAFVDLISGEVALRFFEAFIGFCDRGFSVEKECEVSWSTVQGFPAHIERYRNSPVMHSLVPEDFKPLLFVDGHPVPFPEPTKRIREPRNWKRTQE